MTEMETVYFKVEFDSERHSQHGTEITTTRYRVVELKIEETNLQDEIGNKLAKIHQIGELKLGLNDPFPHYAEARPKTLMRIGINKVQAALGELFMRAFGNRVVKKFLLAATRLPEDKLVEELK